MYKTLVKGAVIGGLTVFIWGLFSWMVFPWHQRCLNKFTNESRVAEVIQNNAPVSGMYVLPNTFSYSPSTSQHEMSHGMQMMENGPFMFASIRLGGMGKMSLKPFIISFIIQFIGAWIISWMLFQTKGLPFRKQVRFVTFFGLAIGILSQLPDWNWWGFSCGYVFINIVDYLIGWFLAGLGIVKVLKRY